MSYTGACSTTRPFRDSPLGLTLDVRDIYPPPLCTAIAQRARAALDLLRMTWIVGILILCWQQISFLLGSAAVHIVYRMLT